MGLYSKNREISDNELDQVLGGAGVFGGSVLKYQIETDLERLSTENPAVFRKLSAERDRLIKEGGRRVFNNTDNAQVQSFVRKLREAMN